MISVIGAANSGKPKSSLTQYEKFVRIVFRRPALDCLAMGEDAISHARLPHGEVGWDPSRGNLRFEKIVATLHRSSQQLPNKTIYVEISVDIEGPKKERATRQQLN